MKKITIIAAILGASLASYSQNARVLPNGNYIAVDKTRDSTSTGLFIELLDGKKVPVWENYKGKPFYCLTNEKTGKYRRVPIKVTGIDKD